MIQRMETSHKVVTIGLIGAGARLRTVVKNLTSANAHIQVGAIHDPDPLSVEAARAEFGRDIPAYDSVSALVSSPALDWVFIGSFNHLHSAQAIAALNAGKAVFCEKPLATNLEDCLAVQNAVRTSGRPFAFGLVLRYAPIYQKVRELIAAGVLGELISFEFNETLEFNHGGYIFGNWRRHTALAGTHLLEKCCHDIDLANWITGSLPVRAASFGGKDFFVPKNEPHITRLGPDAKGQPAYRGWPDPHGVNPFSDGADIVDNQVAILDYANGVRGTFHTNCNTAIPERRFYLCGTEGAIRANAITGKVEWRRIGHDTALEEVIAGPAGGHVGGDEAMAVELGRTLLEDAPPQASVDDGLRACVAAFGIDQAMNEGRVVDLHPLWQQAGIVPPA